MKVTTWIEVVSSSSQVETGLKRIKNVAGDYFADIIIINKYSNRQNRESDGEHSFRLCTVSTGITEDLQTQRGLVQFMYPLNWM